VSPHYLSPFLIHLLSLFFFFSSRDRFRFRLITSISCFSKNYLSRSLSKMFANKENLVLQAPITSKANPKTPAPGKSSLKTPFKVPLNDENVIGVVNLKTGKKGFLAGRDASSFITPVGKTYIHAKYRHTLN
jgi:hypothetical protein